MNEMTSRIPQTRHSLLLRIKDPHDHAAWSEFAEIYRPAVYRFVRRRGLLPEDAEDVAQQVLIALMQKIGSWDTESSGSFRAWLLTVTRNAVANKMNRRPPDVGRGGTSMLQRLSSAFDEDEDSALQWELRRAAFRWAAEAIRDEFQESTWQAFWRTAVQCQASSKTADELGISVGAVYTARSRVLKRLREVTRELAISKQ